MQFSGSLKDHDTQYFKSFWSEGVQIGSLFNNIVSKFTQEYSFALEIGIAMVENINRETKVLSTNFRAIGIPKE
jgi:hypothetical protein